MKNYKKGMQGAYEFDQQVKTYEKGQALFDLLTKNNNALLF